MSVNPVVLELAEHAALLADIADPERELPEATTVRHLVSMVTDTRAADPSALDAYEQTDHTARHTDVASREF